MNFQKKVKQKKKQNKKQKKKQNKKNKTMKKILSILFLMSFCFVAMAQTVTLPTMEAYSKGGTYQIVTTDYNLDTTTVRNFVFTAPQPSAATQDYIIKLNSVFGNHTAVTVALYGQKSPIKADWTQISTTVTWARTTADTVIIISNATANRYRNYKAVVTGTGNGRTKIDTQELKLYR